MGLRLLSIHNFYPTILKPCFFKNIKYAFRNLKRDKLYTLLNGIGLTIGIAVGLLIFMWIQDEISYDNYHSQNGQNYLVLANISFGGERSWGIRTPAPLQSAIKEQIPEVQNIARTSGLWKPVLKYENFVLGVDNTFLIDPELFQILDFEFLQGDPTKGLPAFFYDPRRCLGLILKPFQGKLYSKIKPERLVAST